MDGDVGDPEKERKSRLQADFAQLAAQVLARKVHRTLRLLDSLRELKLALRMRCWPRIFGLGTRAHSFGRQPRSGLVVRLLASHIEPASAGGLCVAPGIYPSAKWAFHLPAQNPPHE